MSISKVYLPAMRFRRPARPARPVRPLAPPIASRRVRVGGTRIHYRVAGHPDAPPLVLVHGYSASSAWWRRNIVGLAACHRVYALDLAGFGRSWPKRRFSVLDAAHDIRAWMREMGLEQADFCGHSMGGHICIHLAATYPRQVGRLALVDASGLPLGGRLHHLAWRGLRSSGHTHFRFAPTVVGTSLQAGPLVLLSALRGLLADDVQGVLADIAAPTLIIWGERDVLVPLELGHALHAAIKGSRLAVVPGAGHNVMYECPEEFNRLVEEFLDRP